MPEKPDDTTVRTVHNVFVLTFLKVQPLLGQLPRNSSILTSTVLEAIWREKPEVECGVGVCVCVCVFHGMFFVDVCFW